MVVLLMYSASSALTCAWRWASSAAVSSSSKGQSDENILSIFSSRADLFFFIWFSLVILGDQPMTYYVYIILYFIAFIKFFFQKTTFVFIFIEKSKKLWQ